MLPGDQRVESEVGGADVYPLRATKSSAQRLRNSDVDSRRPRVNRQRREESKVSAGLTWALNGAPRTITKRRCARRVRDIGGPSNGSRLSCGRLARRRKGDRKSTRLNSSHGYISYAVF